MSEQNRTALNWEDVRVFVALARYGNLSAAARALNVNHATISRRVSSLEAALGEKLVERRPDGYVLTPAGTRALASANDMETAAATLGRGGADDKPKGLVRVNAPPTLTQVILVPRLARLAAQHSGLDIDVSSEFRNVSLERRETDIALCFGRPEDGDVIAKHLATVSFGFYASAQWRRRIEEGAMPDFVGYDEVNAYIPEAVWLMQHFPGARIAFRTNNQLSQAAAASAHAGVALLPHFVGRDYEGIEPCPLQHKPPPREVWLVTRWQDRKNLPIRIVVDYLTQLYAEEHELFEASPERTIDRVPKRDASAD
jgi:DNA-binding transcriptional LysR family regulator